MRSRTDKQAVLPKALGSQEQTVPEEHHVITALIAQHLGMPAEVTPNDEGSPVMSALPPLRCPPLTIAHTHPYVDFPPLPSL